MSRKRKAPSTAFQAGERRTVEAARKGGLAKALKERRMDGPYEGTILDVMRAAGLTGPSWAAWWAFLRAVFALTMDAAAFAIYQAHTERQTAPANRFREAWMAVGRRGGKSRIAAVVALYLAISFDTSNLAPGELAVVPILAADRKQARAIFGYLRALFEVPEFAQYLHRELKETLELHNGVNIEIHTASYRTVRGYTCVGVVCDEIAFWRTDDSSANPDSEVLAALRPAMATVPGALLLGLSSPYASKGELYDAVQRSFGKPDPHVLVWNADTRSMNPDVPASIVDRAFERDPVAAAAEFGQDGRVQFRSDVAAYLDPAAIRAVTADGRRELPPLKGTTYRAFVDPSGGRHDSFTLAIAHAEDQLAVLDCLREVRPPFSPDSVVEDFAALLKSYGLATVEGDRYAGEWPRERFQVHGIRYEPSERTKSDLYRELVAPVNAARVELLDLPRLRAQLVGLERRVARGGKDSIDHGPGGHDDVANAAAGALVAVLGVARPGLRGRVSRPATRQFSKGPKPKTVLVSSPTGAKPPRGPRGMVWVPDNQLGGLSRPPEQTPTGEQS